MSAARTQHGHGIGGMFLAALGLAMLFLLVTLPTPLYPLYQQRFGFGQLALAFVYSIYVLGNLSALFFFGRFSDQAGRRFTVWPALLIGLASAAVFGFAGGIAWLLVARALGGFATGLGSGTLTAWIAELQPRKDGNSGAVTATTANFAGLAAGPILGSVPAQFGWHPLRSPYVVYFAALLLTGVLLACVRETVRRPERRLAQLSLRPRFGVPKAIRASFVSPAVTAFITFALIGFYAALIPNVLAHALQETRPLAAGIVTFILFAVAALSVVLTRRLASRSAMLLALGLFIPGVALLILAEQLHQMPILLAAAVLGGAAASLGYRGSLAVVNRIAPGEQRGEVVSTYLIVVYCGNSLPVIGIGLLSAGTGPATAHLVFACVVVALAVTGLGLGWKYAPRDDANASHGHS